MKFITLMLWLTTFSTSANAQECHDDLYLNNDECVTTFDEVIDENKTVKNVLVRHNDVINYYHKSTVTENHYNINGRTIGYARYSPRRQMNYAPRRVVIVPRAIGYYEPREEVRYIPCEQSQYKCLADDNDNKWFFVFQLNSDYLTNREELCHLINYAKDNVGSVFYIDSYADAETGGYEVNMRISKMRANAIISVLLREGIERNRLYVQCHGSVSQPYKTNNLNRCVTVATKFK